MTEHPERDRMFELHMQNYELNQMYPPTYRKDVTMVKMTMEHINAICHAEFFTNAAIGKADGSRMRKAIEDDLMRLAELKICIIEQLTKPQGTFELRDKPDGNESSTPGPNTR